MNFSHVLQEHDTTPSEKEVTKLSTCTVLRIDRYERQLNHVIQAKKWYDTLERSQSFYVPNGDTTSHTITFTLPRGKNPFHQLYTIITEHALKLIKVYSTL